MGTNRVRGARLTHVAAIGAMAGLPPSGMFAGWYLLLVAAIQRNAWLAWPLGAGLIAFLAALVAKLLETGAVATDDARGVAPVMALVPVWLYLAIGMLIGYAMPDTLAQRCGESE